MTDPYVHDPDFTLHVGDALEVLQGLPSESVHMCVTSPPFFGLRDYGTGTWEGGNPDCDHTPPKQKERKFTNGRGEGGGDGYAGSNLKSWTDRDGTAYGQTCGKCGARRVDRQIGLEASPDEWVARLVDVFREVRRVLRKDGTLWLEIGDSYAGNNDTGETQRNSPSYQARLAQGSGQDGSFKFSPRTDNRQPLGQRKNPSGYRPKDLIGAPWLLAFALRADGWYLRSDIIWARPNPMPESVRDRPTKSHSYVFLLSKSPRYFFDQEAVRELHEASSLARYEYGGAGANGKPYAMQQSPRGHEPGRNIRSVWTIATEPLPDEHYAAYPQKLVERCILAGSSERGCCPECGAPWERVVERTPMQIPERVQAPRVGSEATSLVNDGERRRAMNGQEWAKSAKTETLGWRPSCNCTWPGAVVPREPIPCMVLDPFLGSGTTALVARRLGRHTIGIELSPTYAAMAARRLQQLSLLA